MASAAVAGIAGGTLVAHANWAIPGAGKVSIRAATVPRGVVPSVAKVAKRAVVSWSAQEIGPGSAMTSYVVTAHSVDVPPQPDLTETVRASGGPAESVTFGAARVAGGRWRWTIRPRFGSWAGAESGPSKPLTFPEPAERKAETAEAAPTTSPGPAEEPAEEPAAEPAGKPEPSPAPSSASPSPADPSPSTPAPAASCHPSCGLGQSVPTV